MGSGHNRSFRMYGPLKEEYNKHNLFNMVSLQSLIILLLFIYFIIIFFFKASSPEPGIFNKHLINLQDEEWKEVRSVVTPAFSAVKMRTVCGRGNGSTVELLNQTKHVINNLLSL